ncbi:MAG: hypothetical protein H8D46_02600 [FCB group bacterium]|nr:hypothetical protein [FCB group bacterium]
MKLCVGEFGWLKTCIISLVFVFLFLVNPLFSAEAWPGDSEWVGIYNANWEKLQDLPSDQNSTHLNFVFNAGEYSAYTFYANNTYYFRLVLEGSPIHSGTQLKSSGWLTGIDVDGNDLADWEVVLQGGNPTELHVNYDSDGDESMDMTTLTVVDPLATGDARLTGTGPYYLDYQVSELSLQDGAYVNNINSDTPVNLILLTVAGGSLNSVVKDFSDPIATSLLQSFQNSISSTLSANGGYGYLHDTEDSAPLTQAGLWGAYETVYISGFGFPPSTSPFWNAHPVNGNGIVNIRILEGITVVHIDSFQTDIYGTILQYGAPGAPGAPIMDLGTTPATDIVYTVQTEDPTTRGVWNSYDQFTFTPSLSIDTDPAILSKFQIMSAYPNPFNPVTKIEYYVPWRCAVNLSAYDIGGRRVDQLVNDYLEVGFHSIDWTAENLPSGIYFIRMRAGMYNNLQKVTIMR